ncbi:MAG: YiiX family permuted papain-like enzyme [Chitinophagaceae bacterium]|nr:YiiX family permuted papain-like enzyme [Chitinophagaceae bacterium]
MKPTYLLIAGLICISCFIVPKFYTDAQIKKHITKQAYQNGDIIFQSSNSRQCQAVKFATHSDVSHCGMLLEHDGEWYVLEAVEPVQETKLSTFISRGNGQHYTIKRNKNTLLTDEQVEKIKLAAGQFIGKHYDIYFNWSNTEIYCSELVWKLYREAGIDICAPRKLKDFDLSHPLVVTMMKERYGSKIPLEETVVAPSDIYQSAMLTTVEER